MEYSKITKSPTQSFKASSLPQYENLFWSSLGQNPPLYGSDIQGSLFEDADNAGEWDLRNLDSCLHDGMGSKKLSGINTPYLYFGSFRTIFAWHVEDYNMSSINFQHFGSPKIWYGVARKVNLKIK
jgi:jumonji domain-containing protein 2